MALLLLQPVPNDGGEVGARCAGWLAWGKAVTSVPVSAFGDESFQGRHIVRSALQHHARAHHAIRGFEVGLVTCIVLAVASRLPLSLFERAENLVRIGDLAAKAQHRCDSPA